MYLVLLPTPPRKCAKITRLCRVFLPQVLWERGSQRTRGNVWSRVLLRARGHFTSPRERNRSFCRRHLLGRLCLRRGKKSRGSPLNEFSDNRVPPQFAAPKKRRNATSPPALPARSFRLGLLCLKRLSSYLSPFFLLRRERNLHNPLTEQRGTCAPKGHTARRDPLSPWGAPRERTTLRRQWRSARTACPGSFAQATRPFPKSVRSITTVRLVPPLALLVPLALMDRGCVSNFGEAQISPRY